MIRSVLLLTLLILSITNIFSQVILLPSNGLDPAVQWSSYRGYLASGSMDNANLPDSWNVGTGKNILWKSQIPGLGLSSPIIWGDNLFITTAVSTEDGEGFKTGIYGSIGSVDDESVHEWKVICLDKNTGETVWERTACQGIPKQKRHPKSSHANSTLACDGNFVVPFFGSEGLYCYDINGDLQWKKDFGLLRSVFFAVERAEWEFASSPVNHKGVLIVQCDVMENSFVAAYDVRSGDELWKKERNEYIRWSIPRGGSYMQTMLIYDNLLYNLNWNGSMVCLQPETGAEVWKHKAGSGNSYISSPVASDGKIYAIDDQGMVYIIRAGSSYELIAQNDLGEVCMTTPAISGNTIFFRTINQLIAVSDIPEK